MGSYVDITKADTSVDYQVDDRVTIFVPLEPVSADIFDGPTLAVASGIRVNTDASGV